MSHKNKICLKMQSKQIFDKLVCFGRSKYEDKCVAAAEYDRLPPEQRTGTTQEYINSKIRDKIYSYGTYGDYVKHINYFLKWCEDTYRCKTLKQCREHVDEWLTLRIEQGLSAYTLKLEAAALGKLYQEPTLFLHRTASVPLSHAVEGMHSVITGSHWKRTRKLLIFVDLLGYVGRN